MVCLSTSWVTLSFQNVVLSLWGTHMHIIVCILCITLNFLKQESLMILLRVGWNAAWRTVCAWCVKAGPIEVFGRGVWERARFLEIFNESSNFHPPCLLRCSAFSWLFEFWFSQAFCITDDLFLHHGVLLIYGILWLPCPPSSLSPPPSSHLPEICWDLSSSNALPPFLLLQK